MLSPHSSGFDSGPPNPDTGMTMREAAGPYLRALRHHWRFVLLITVLAAAIASVTLVRSHNSYDGSASILLSPVPDGDPAWVGTGAIITSGDPDRDMQTGVALVDSDQAAAATARAMGSGWTTQRVQDSVSVTPLGESNVISVAATGSTPQQAARLANTFATQAVGVRAKLVQANIAKEVTSLRAQVATEAGKSGGSTELATIYPELNELQNAQASGGDPTLSVSQAAQPPTAPVGTSRVLIVLLSLVGGLLIGSVAALGLEFLSRPVRDEVELAELFPGPVLASIPSIRHAGSGPLDPWRLSAEGFEQARMLRVQLELEDKSPLVMVTSASAGDGKTSVVSALAASFSESGRRTVLVDLDLRKPSLAHALKLELPRPPRSLDGIEWLRHALVPVPALPNVSLLSLAQLGGWGIDETMRRLPTLLEELESFSDAVVIDTAPIGEVSETLRVANLCREIVFVARLRHTDRRQLSRSRDLLLRIGARPDGMVIVGKQLGRTHGDYAYAATSRLADTTPQRSQQRAAQTQPAALELRGR
jgi:succinoglycan biosynthesis transport protein ExoP